MGKRARLSLTALVAAAAITVSAPSAFAQESPANSPEPVAGEPSCDGLIIAAFNHETLAVSENPKASAGPGPFFGSGTHEAIETLAREPFCTP